MKTDLVPPRISDAEYRLIEAVSNSDLTRLRDLLFARNRPVNTKALQMGSALHQSVLEPHLEKNWSDLVDVDIVESIKDNLYHFAPFQALLQQADCEVVRVWKDEQTGVLCKGKLDMVCAQGILADIKTTSCESAEAFRRICQTYDYDRQVAFYWDSFKKETQQPKKFVLFGIQKNFPYQIFTYELFPNDYFVKRGRAKYQSLLKTWKNNHDDKAQRRKWIVLD
ncbi:MAG: PD-(D/E)XK nuclease-like domain-containing protein [Spirosomataceae bacterium]